MTANLLPCPFCGGIPKFGSARMISGEGYRAQCSCGVRTTVIAPGKYLLYHGKGGVTFTDEEAAQEVQRIWNTRKDWPGSLASATASE